MLKIELNYVILFRSFTLYCRRCFPVPLNYRILKKKRKLLKGIRSPKNKQTATTTTKATTTKNSNKTRRSVLKLRLLLLTVTDNCFHAK